MMSIIQLGNSIQHDPGTIEPTQNLSNYHTLGSTRLQVRTSCGSLATRIQLKKKPFSCIKKNRRSTSKVQTWTAYSQTSTGKTRLIPYHLRTRAEPASAHKSQLGLGFRLLPETGNRRPVPELIAVSASSGQLDRGSCANRGGPSPIQRIQPLFPVGTLEMLLRRRVDVKSRYSIQAGSRTIK